MTPGGGVLRLTRVALFALIAVGLAGSAHVAGGGVVSWRAALVAVLVVMLVANRAAGTRRGPAGLFAGMAGAQAALHLGFMAAGVSAHCAPGPTGAVGTGPAVGTGAAAAMPGHPVVSCAPGQVHTEVTSLWPSTGMGLTHLLAALLLTGMLAHGERVLWALAAVLGARILPVPQAPLPLPVAPRQPVASVPVPRPARVGYRRALPRRGPPVTALAVRPHR